MLQIRNAETKDIDRIMIIYRRAQDFMIQTGNPSQWAHTYPSEELIRQDIEAGVCKLIVDDTGDSRLDSIRGVFALFDGDEPTYQIIEDGAWLNDEPYLTIHRIASSGEVPGVFAAAASYCKELSANVRIDTHADNAIMQRQVEKAGFVLCGRIYVADGSPRVAYQWTRD